MSVCINETYPGCGSSAQVECVLAGARWVASGLYRNTTEPVVPIGVARNGQRLTAIVVVFGRVTRRVQRWQRFATYRGVRGASPRGRWRF